MIKTKIPCSVCGELRCHKHCNNCSDEIFWRPPNLDKGIAYNGPRPLNKDGTVHRCMGSGTRDGNYLRVNANEERRFPRIKASVILCPLPKCNFPCIEGDKKLINEFQSHMQSEHRIELKNFDKIQERIEYLRTNPKIHYQDPFIHIPIEELTI